MAKVEAQISYIADKEGLEDGIPNYRRLGEGLGLGKDYKNGSAASGAAAEFERINARAARAIGAKHSYSPQATTAQPLWLRAHAPAPYQLVPFKSRIGLRGARKRR